MFDYQQKKKIRKVIYSKITLVILFIFIIILIKANYGIFKKERLSNENYNIVKDDFDSLKNRKSILESEIQRMKTEEGIEEEIRSKFDVSKPGEVVVNIIDDNKSTTTNNKDGKVGFWSKVIGWFK